MNENSEFLLPLNFIQFVQVDGEGNINGLVLVLKGKPHTEEATNQNTRVRGKKLHIADEMGWNSRYKNAMYSGM